MTKNKQQTTSKRPTKAQKAKEKLRRALKNVVDAAKLSSAGQKPAPLPSSENNSSSSQIRKNGDLKTVAPSSSTRAPVPTPSNGTTKPKLEAKDSSKLATSSASMKAENVKKKLPTKTNDTDAQIVSSQPSASSKSGKSKRYRNKFVEESIDANQLNAKKVKRNNNGFIETNADSKEETEFVNKILQAQRHRIMEAMGLDPTIPIEKFSVEAVDEVSKPSIVVHDIANGKSPEEKTATSDSDSEDDSYIDRFFDVRNANDEFNSNDALCIDEIEKLSPHNGFLSSDSEVIESTTNDTSESSSSPIENAVLASTKKQKSSDHKKQLVHYNGNGNVSNDDDDDSDSCEEYSDVSDSDGYDNYDFGDYFNELDGEYISDGDDYGGDSMDDYTDDSSDIEDEDGEEELEEEETDYSMYEGDSSDHTSDHEHYSDDTDSYHDDDDDYDDFMNGRFKDDSNDTDFCDSDYDDLVIAQGTAISYKLSDSRIKLFENDTKARIVELPISDTEDEDCAKLVSLNVSREEIMSIERHKRQTKKMQDDLAELQAKKREADHQRKCEAYFKLDEANAASETEIEDRKPVVITCLPGIVSDVSIQFSSEATSDSSNELPDMNVSQLNRSVITSVPLNIPPPMDVDIDENLDSSASSNRSPEREVPAATNSPVDYSESERIKDRNTNLSKSQIAKTKPIFFNSINSQHVLLLLRNIIHFHGNLQMKLIAGNAQVFGYQLERNKYVTVHSPRGHSLIYLVPVAPRRKSPSNTTTFAALHELKTDFLSQDIDELIAKFNQGTDAIILLERDTKHKGVNMIDRYMRETMFPNINAFNNDSPYYASEFILHCQFSHWPRNGLTLNEGWSSVTIKNTTRLVTIGGKGVGKSTFVRYAINSNINKLKKFVFVDLDIGQPELFVPQTISATLLTSPILGPGYLENIPPTKAIFFGEINVLLNPIKYLRCVLDLYEFCSKCEAFENVPWVINTMGYSRSLGPELMACILRVFKPTDVVQIQSDSSNENFETIIDTDYVNTFKFNIFDGEMADVNTTSPFRTHTFNAIIGNKSKQPDMTPKDIRYAMVLSKLGNCLRCNSDWLTSVRPYEVSLNDLRIIVANGESIDPVSVTDVLNANLVYLCESKTTIPGDIVDCHGIGVVRAIDTSTEKLYLLPSIPVEELAKVNTLAIGAIPLPSAVLLNQHGQVRGNIPFVYNSDGFVGSKQVAQHIFRSEKNRKNNPIQLVEH